jgi:hypothetical protein
MRAMTRHLAAGGAFLLLLLLIAASCSVEYECADACNRVYEQCDSTVELQGFALEQQQCELVCEEGRERPEDGAAAWLDCIEDSVCPGELADGEDRDMRRYDVTWCNPQFELLVEAM